MALTNVAPTVFDNRTVFQTLAASGYKESGVSEISRSLRTVLNPEGLPQLLMDPFFRSGFSADTPSLFYHPNRLSLENILLLAELNSGFGAGGFGEPDKVATQVLDNIQENITIDSLPFIRNLAKDTITTAYAALGATTLLAAQETPEVISEDELLIRGTDFARAPLEGGVFGTTYSAVATDTTLNSQFYQRFGFEQGGSIALADLVQSSASGSPTHYAIRLSGTDDSNPHGQILDGGGVAVSSDTVLTAAELATYSYSAPTNVGWDFLSIIELEDTDSNGSYEGRGEFTSIGLITGKETIDAFYGDDSTPEQTASYTFYNQGGIVQDEFTLVFDGVNSAGFTDAFAAIDGGAFQVRVSETLADGTVNKAVVDLHVSSANEIKIKFAYSPAEYGMQTTGIKVDLHTLNTNFDLSNVTIYSRFA